MATTERPQNDHKTAEKWPQNGHKMATKNHNVGKIRLRNNAVKGETLVVMFHLVLVGRGGPSWETPSSSHVPRGVAYISTDFRCSAVVCPELHRFANTRSLISQQRKSGIRSNLYHGG
jgi:hypothetical protein